MKITFIGATHEVTGSCYYLEAAGKRFLVDYGMEQGPNYYENQEIPVAPGELDFVLLTHAHMDHAGMLPALYAKGFQGPIYATEATCHLCDIMLRDSAHIQMFEAEWRNRKGRRQGKADFVPVYTMEDALEVIIDYRGKTPKKSEKGIPTLSAKSVKNNHIDYDSCYYISSDEYKRFMVRGLPQIGDVLLTTEAPLGMVAQLDRNDVGIAQRLLTLRGKQGILDNEYLLYYLQSPIGQALLRARETGTTVTGIKQSEFRKIQIDIPDIENQRKIGGILRRLDDKIAVNDNINKNLAA